jgi:hypothetical protein
MSRIQRVLVAASLMTDALRRQPRSGRQVLLGQPGGRPVAPQQRAEGGCGTAGHRVPFPALAIVPLPTRSPSLVP